MFFIQGLGESTVAESPGGSQADDIAARLTFQGEPPGSLMLRLTPGAARRISADFLGFDEEEVSEVQTADVVRELANMICGSLLSRVESATAFRLGEPRIVPPAEETVGSLCNIRYGRDLSSGRLTVNVATGTLTCLQPESAY